MSSNTIYSNADNSKHKQKADTTAVHIYLVHNWYQVPGSTRYQVRKNCRILSQGMFWDILYTSGMFEDALENRFEKFKRPKLRVSLLPHRQ